MRGGGALQADVAVCGEHSPCSGQAACSFGGLSPGAACLFPPRRAARAARGLAPSPRARRAFSLRGPSMRRRSGLTKSLDRNWGLFAGWEGVASLRLSFPLSLPPASYLQWGYGAALLWSLSVPLFCEPPAVCSDRSIFLSLSHSLKNLPLTALRAFWPVLTLSNAAGSSPFHPLLSVHPSCWWRVRASGGTFLLGVAFRHTICGLYLISPPS